MGVITVSQIMINWQTTPVTVTINDDTHPISAIEFPSVTICPGVKVEKDKFISEVCRLR
jgi:hypothetical protein